MTLADWKDIGLLRMNEIRAWVILPAVRTRLRVAGWGCGTGLSLCLVHYSSLPEHQVMGKRYRYSDQSCWSEHCNDKDGITSPNYTRMVPS